MILLILGLLLWVSAHLFKRMAPGPRAAMGDRGRLYATVAIFASLAMMILGYRGAETVILWYPPPFTWHINNTLMLLAVYLYAASGLKTWITTKIRHPQLTAVKTWAVAHLLVNGDLASLVLFGGLLAWAVVSVIVINRANRQWTRPAPAGAAKEAMAVVGTLAVFAVIVAIHTWLGYYPLPGGMG